ncbi:MAG: hypothetical protein JST83_12005 [Bacteroidetes bacterium]|nr:hypothetical protein [Bacteroidota bacterium]
MKTFINKHRYGLAGMALLLSVALALLIFTDGTCDEGDSVYHYLFARYARQDPELFFYHWAKPLYTLLFCPAAQFGFAAVRAVNVAVCALTVWLAYLIAFRLEYRWAPAVFVIALFFKLFVICAFSGLTEPLAGLLVMAGIYLMMDGKYILTALLLSFLPFVRSEGLFLCSLFAAYMMWQRQWRALPLFLTGHIIYGLAGAKYNHNNPFWVIQSIPYLAADQHYGHGDWLYYIKELPTITGPVNAFLLALGVLMIIFNSIAKLMKRRSGPAISIPLFLCVIFLVFLFLHSAFWALGIFGSFGLTRVFVAMGGVMLLLMIIGLDYAAKAMTLARIPPTVLALVLLTVSAWYAVRRAPYSYSSYDFQLHTDQCCDRDAATYIRQHIANYHDYNFYFDACYFSEVLQINLFNDDRFSNNAPNTMYKHRSIILWDDFYSDFEHHTTLDTLRHHADLTELHTFTGEVPWGGQRKVVLFIKN